jgi:hypothetical protein
MLKLRLKRTGRKRSPSYRLVIMENTFRRDGRPAVWPSGKAVDCKSSIPSSNLGAALIFKL